MCPLQPLLLRCNQCTGSDGRESLDKWHKDISRGCAKFSHPMYGMLGKSNVQSANILSMQSRCRNEPLQMLVEICPSVKEEPWYSKLWLCTRLLHVCVSLTWNNGSREVGIRP
jgi:hypothetical protein